MPKASNRTVFKIGTGPMVGEHTEHATCSSAEEAIEIAEGLGVVFLSPILTRLKTEDGVKRFDTVHNTGVSIWKEMKPA